MATFEPKCSQWIVGRCAISKKINVIQTAILFAEGVYDQCRKFFWKYLIKRWNRSTHSAIRIRITICYFTFLPLFSEHCVSGTWFPLSVSFWSWECFLRVWPEYSVQLVFSKLKIHWGKKIKSSYFSLFSEIPKNWRRKYSLSGLDSGIRPPSSVSWRYFNLT